MSHTRSISCDRMGYVTLMLAICLLTLVCISSRFSPVHVDFCKDTNSSGGGDTIEKLLD